MESKDKYKISWLGEFVDKTLENEFIYYDMKCCSKFLRPVALIFGVIFMLFIIADCLAIKNVFSLIVLFVIRALFLSASVILYFTVKKIMDYSSLTYVITAYEILAITSFMMIIDQYGSISITSFFSLVAITLALYITPNKLINTQITSVFFNLFFFILFINHIENIKNDMVLKIIMYSLIIIILGTIGAYLTNLHKRKHFADKRELLKLSVTDTLTGIYNRTKFDEELNHWIDYCSKYENTLSLILFDIDDFKRVNDNYGHIVGDAVIQNMAAIIKKTIRGTDIFARWGGDEFAILLPNVNIHQAMSITERVRGCIQKETYDGVSVTCCFGLVSLHNHENADSLLLRADMFLSDAKKRGNNTVVSETGEIKVCNTVDG